jgi:hypothetical protein
MNRQTIDGKSGIDYIPAPAKITDPGQVITMFSRFHPKAAPTAIRFIRLYAHGGLVVAAVAEYNDSS